MSEEFLRQFPPHDRRKEGQKAFQEWSQHFPREAEIIIYLEKELKNRPYATGKVNTRRQALYEEAHQRRQELGLRDEFVDIVFHSEVAFKQALEKLQQDQNLTFTPTEISIAEMVNWGYRIRAGLHVQIPPDDLPQ